MKLGRTAIHTATLALPKLCISKRAPQVPTGYGSVWTPFFTQSLDIATSSVNVCDGSFESNITKGEDIGLSKHHNLENGKRPWANTLDAGECIVPRFALLDSGANLVRSLKDCDDALRAAFGKTHCTKARDIGDRTRQRNWEMRVCSFNHFGEAACNLCRNLLRKDYADESPNWVFCRPRGPSKRLGLDHSGQGVVVGQQKAFGCGQFARDCGAPF